MHTLHKFKMVTRENHGEKRLKKKKNCLMFGAFSGSTCIEESNLNFLIWIPLVSLKIIKDCCQTPSWKNTYLYNKLFDHDLRCYSSDWWNINCFVYPIVIHIDKHTFHMFHQMHLRLDSYMFIFNLICIQYVIIVMFEFNLVNNCK